MRSQFSYLLGQQALQQSLGFFMQGMQVLFSEKTFRIDLADGRMANQPFWLQTLTPPMAAPLPGAVVSISVTGDPATVRIWTSSAFRDLRQART